MVSFRTMRAFLPLVLFLAAVEAFQAPRNVLGQSYSRSVGTATTSRSRPLHAAVPPIYALLGRFRKKKKVDQVAEIRIGDTIADIDVEQMIVQENGPVQNEPVSIRDVLGPDKAILVGMPGAFTPTCSKQHLPGYISKEATFANKLGISKIVICTTNDRFVNEEWMAANEALKPGSIITMVSDGDGELVKSLGLSDDMGFGVGVRSKRFALVSEGGVVTNLWTDVGMDDCSATSAENVIRLLSPEGSDLGSELEMDPVVVGGALVGVAGLALVALMGGMGGKAPSTSPTPAPRVKVAPTTRESSRTSESSFSLLNEFVKSDGN